MTLLPFVIRVNQHSPFSGLFVSGAAAWDALWGGALSETTGLGGCQLIIQALS